MNLILFVVIHPLVDILVVDTIDSSVEGHHLCAIICCGTEVGRFTCGFKLIVVVVATPSRQLDFDIHVLEGIGTSSQHVEDTFTLVDLARSAPNTEVGLTHLRAGRVVFVGHLDSGILVSAGIRAIQGEGVVVVDVAHPTTVVAVVV